MSKSEGARAPNDRHPSYKSGDLSAPASVCCRAEGAVTSSATIRSHPVASTAGLLRSGSAASALGMRAPLPEGVRAVCCHACTASVRDPGFERTSWSSRHACERKITRPRPGSPTLPRVRRSAAASLVSGKDAGSMGAAERAGISFRF
jgi:hypothetical protein